jgi:hypothetical protein
MGRRWLLIGSASGLWSSCFSRLRVQAYVMFHLPRAKNDKIDAALIAAAARRTTQNPEPARYLLAFRCAAARRGRQGWPLLLHRPISRRRQATAWQTRARRDTHWVALMVATMLTTFELRVERDIG